MSEVQEIVQQIPTWIAVLIVLTDITVAALLWFGATRIAKRLGLPQRTQRRIAILMAVVPAVWLLVAPLLSASLQGVLLPPRPNTSNIGTFPLILTPLLTGLLLLRSKTWRQIVRATPQSWLIGVQFYRNIGFVFLVLMSVGLLPAYFAVPAGYGDLLSGLPTLLVAYLIARGWRGWRRAAWTINLVGMLDFVVALGVGSGLMHNLALSNALFGETQIVTAPFAYFPLSLIPLYVVPIGLVLHTYSLLKLVWERQDARAFQADTNTVVAS